MNLKEALVILEADYQLNPMNVNHMNAIRMVILESYKNSLKKEASEDAEVKRKYTKTNRNKAES